MAVMATCATAVPAKGAESEALRLHGTATNVPVREQPRLGHVVHRLAERGEKHERVAVASRAESWMPGTKISVGCTPRSASPDGERTAGPCGRWSARPDPHEPRGFERGERRLASRAPIAPARHPGLDRASLDDDVTLIVRLPPGSTRGPQVDRERLRHWGKKSATAYRAMLGLAYRWFPAGDYQCAGAR